MRASRIFLIIVVFAVVLNAASYDFAWQKLKSEVLNNDVEGVQVYVYETKLVKDFEIISWQHAEKMPIEGYFFMIDDFPTANWEHPCRYCFVNEQEIIVEKRLAPPNILNTMKELTSFEFENYGISKDLRTVQSVKRTLEETELEHCWAVLISGGGNSGSNHPRYYMDTQFMYETLLSYGYYDDHIIIVFADGTNPAIDQSGGVNSDPDFDSDGDDDINYSCTIANLNTVFSELTSTLTSADQLFIYSTDHGGGGGVDDPDVYLVGWGENIDDSVFANMIEPISCSTIIITMEQCFSGGFIDDLAGEGRIITTAARFDEVSWGGITTSTYDEFVYHWTSAVNFATPYGTPVIADTTGDELVSMAEAYAYALEEDLADEHPQYSSTPATYGDMTFLFGSISDEPFIFKNSEYWMELSGDDDGSFDPDEEFSFIPKLLNLGLEATNVVVKLRSMHTEIVIVDSIIEWTTMASRDTSMWGSDSFIVSLNSTLDYGDSIEFMVDVVADGGYTTLFSSTIRLPLPCITISDFVADDISGDDDGFIDPGENAEMDIYFTNIGLQEARSIVCLVSSSNPDITITQNMTSLTILNATQTLIGESAIEFSYASGADEYAIIEFTAYLSAEGGYTDTITFSIQTSGQYVYPFTEEPELWDISSGWHLTEHRSSIGSLAWYCGSEIDYLYPPDSDFTLTSRYFISLPPNPVLTINEFVAMEPNYDFVHIEYQSPGSSEWIVLSSRTLFAPPWKGYVVDLSSIPTSSAKIRFRLESDGGVEAEGWYIDDINIISKPENTLLCGHVVEKYGLPESEYTYRVTWYSSDGQLPEHSVVFVDGSPHTMNNVGGDNQNGITFEDEVFISNYGEHNYEFQFDEVHAGIYSGPFVIPARDTFNIALNDESFAHSGTTDDWAWGTASGESSSGADGNVWATNLTGNHNPTSAATLETPNINISDYDMPLMLVRHWYQTNELNARQNPLDGAGNIKYCVEGADDIVIAPEMGYDGVASVSNGYIGREQGFGSIEGNSWHNSLFNLNVISADIFNLKFDFGAKSTSPSELGWYIGNIYFLDATDLAITETSNITLPDKVSISAFPNPFNVTCNISYTLPRTAEISQLSIIDINGKQVFSKVLRGNGTISWSAENCPSGVYLVNIKENNNFSSSIKLMLIK